jgi:hypothetical protein
MSADVIAPPEKGQLLVWLFVMETVWGLFSHKTNNNFYVVA